MERKGIVGKARQGKARKKGECGALEKIRHV